MLTRGRRSSPHPLHATERTLDGDELLRRRLDRGPARPRPRPGGRRRVHPQLRLRGRPVDLLQVPARGPAGAVRHRGRRDERLAARRRPRRGAARRWAACARSRGTPGSCPTPWASSYGTDHVKTTIVPAAHRPGPPVARLLPQRRLLRARGRRLRRPVPPRGPRRPDGAAALRGVASASTGSAGTTRTWWAGSWRSPGTTWPGARRTTR